VTAVLRSAEYPLRDGKLDVALIGFKRVRLRDFESIEPVEIDDPRSMQVGTGAATRMGVGNCTI
jgi:hypothetical protein